MKDKSLQKQHKLEDEITTAEYADSFFSGIRAGLDKIAERSGLDKDKLYRKFSEGASEDENFAKLMQRMPKLSDDELAETIIRLLMT